MSADLLLRLLARLLPPLVRRRYLEEWRADLAGAAQLGLPARGVVLGAAALTVRIDRDRPAHSGEPRGALPRRLARRGGGLLIASGGVLAGLWLTGGNTPDPGVAPSLAPALLVAGRALAVLALAAGAVAVVLLLAAGATARTWLARASLLAAVVGPALVAAAVTGRLDHPLALPAGGLLLMAGLVGGVVVLAGSPPLMLQHRVAPRSRRVPTALAGLAVLVAVIVVGGIDLLVWNPQSKVPSLPLPAIYAGMAERDGFDLTSTVVVVAIWALIWTGAGVVVTVAACLRGSSALTPRRIAVALLAIVSAAVFFRFFAGFGIGMSIADSFETSGGDGSVVSALLACVGQLALAGSAVALGWAPRTASAAATA